jgi:hypothetical protein
MNRRVIRRAHEIPVNQLTRRQVKLICRHLQNDTFKVRGKNERIKYLEFGLRGIICNLAPTRNRRGGYKYPQIDISRWTGRSGKVLVHAVWWRFVNNYKLIDPNLELSHLDANPKYIDTVLESAEMNESRKSCHLFKWYLKTDENYRPLCPHRMNHPCTGPDSYDEE